MKFIVFSDLHIHNYRRFDNGGSRLNNTLSVLIDIFTYADDNNITTILFGGDLFNKPRIVYTEVFYKTQKLFLELFQQFPNIKFLAIDGNHDLNSKNTLDEDSISPLLILNDTLDNFILINNSYYPLDDGNYVLGIPYFEYSKDFLDKLALLYNDAYFKDKLYLLIHQTPTHSNSMIPADFPPEIFYNDFNHVFCGHIHKHEILNDKFTIIGSPLHRDFSDAGLNKGFIVYDTSVNTFDRVYLDYPKFEYSDDVKELTVTEKAYTMPKRIIKDTMHGFELSGDNFEILKRYIKNIDKDEIYYTIGKTLL